MLDLLEPRVGSLRVLCQVPLWKDFVDYVKSQPYGVQDADQILFTNSFSPKSANNPSQDSVSNSENLQSNVTKLDNNNSQKVTKQENETDLSKKNPESFIEDRLSLDEEDLEELFSPQPDTEGNV
eukprot:TRINITY_DN6927_c0_g1_i1.p1 TRINITY_DN6927_c0_g1~~TRINITY_DN6927_c0_g1_i1.p1  ORF type:complete len:125 (+),score=21.82 TRINITY_DN6927_c0_g1_i1:82-456(+)